MLRVVSLQYAEDLVITIRVNMHSRKDPFEIATEREIKEKFERKFLFHFFQNDKMVNF